MIPATIPPPESPVASEPAANLAAKGSRRRRKGVLKRSPEIPFVLHSRYAKLSKAEWAEAFFDLFIECCASGSEPDAMTDAERRTEILRTYRKAEAKSK